MDKKAQILRILSLTCRVLFGLTFIFSGFVKAIDPLGFAYKMDDYLEVFNLMQLSPLTLATSVAMSAVEFAIGCCILFGIRLTEIAWLGFAFMAFYTPLTLWIAIANPVTDCGCFGDALVISNWQTFWKNVVLLLCIIVVLCTRKAHKAKLSSMPSWLLVANFFFISMALSFYCLQSLPIIDFRPYKIGANIAEGMTIPENAEKDVYETTFVYEKDGVEQEFTLDNYPWQDTTWHFVDQTSVLVRKGYTPPIHDFVITSLDGDDITEELLTSEDTTYLVVMYDLQKTDTCEFNNLRELYASRTNEHVKFMALTASYEAAIDNFKQATGLPFEFCTADPIMLKTMVRANPGIVVIERGTIIDKFNNNSTYRKLNKKRNKFKKK